MFLWISATVLATSRAWRVYSDLWELMPPRQAKTRRRFLVVERSLFLLVAIFAGCVLYQAIVSCVEARRTAELKLVLKRIPAEEMGKVITLYVHLRRDVARARMSSDDPDELYQIASRFCEATLRRVGDSRALSAVQRKALIHQSRTALAEELQPGGENELPQFQRLLDEFDVAASD